MVLTMLCQVSRDMISNIGHAIAGAVTRAVVGAGTGIGRALAGLGIGATAGASINGTLISGATAKLFGGSFSYAFKRSLSPAAIITTGILVGHKIYTELKQAVENMLFAGPNFFDLNRDPESLGDSFPDHKKYSRKFFI